MQVNTALAPSSAAPVADADLVRDSVAVLAHHGRTFHLASHLLPRDRRAEAAIVYAFCRLVDDLADEAPDLVVARRDLEAVKRQLAGGPSAYPVVAAFLEVARRRQIDPRAAEHLVHAVTSDLEPVRIADDDALRRYCYGVAGTVGLMMCGVLGVQDRAALTRAVDLGIAMQITNICRDVREDAERGRIYLPLSRLREAGVDPDALLTGQLPDRQRRALAVVVTDLLDLAERHYASANEGMRAIPMPARAAILVAARVYRAIGLRLHRVHGSDALHGRTIVPTWQRLWVALGSLQQLLRKRYWLGDIGVTAPELHRGLSGLPGLEA
ncbi:MAG: phytoene/squalene synthase family protein [Myxococcales bacterium]|nr:phytoene/squalene synthase family protein [Myxococcales bacterium]